MTGADAEGDSAEQFSFVEFRQSVIWQTLASHKGLIAAVGVMGAINGLIVFFTVETTKAIIDEALVAGTADLAELVRSLQFLAILLFIFGLAMRQLIARAWYTVEYELRVHIHSLLTKADPRRLDSVSSGQVLTRLMTDFESLQTVILMIPGIAFGAILLTVLSIYLAVLQPQIALLGVIAIPLNLMILKRVWPRLNALSWLNLHTKARVTTAIDEQVRGIRVVRAFGRQSDASQLIAERSGEAYEVGMTRVRLLARYDIVLKAFPILLDAAIMFFALRLLINGSMTPGTYLVFVGVAGVLTSVAQGVDELGNGAAIATSGTSRIMELLAQAGDSEQQDAGSPAPIASGVQANECVYGDREGNQLGSFSLALSPGSIGVLIGASDVAKHAAAAVLCGQRDPVGGSMQIGSISASEFAGSGRGAIRLLDEHPYLFGRTIRENLEVGLGRKLTESDDQLIQDSLETSHFAPVLSRLPEGLDTVLADRGLTLSGGERQRLALARALLVPPPVLIMDDALSAIDPALELDILGRIRSHSPATVVVLLTRRPSALRAADASAELVDPHARVLERATQSHQDPTLAGSFDEDLPSQHGLREGVEAIEIGDDVAGFSDSVAEDYETPPSWRKLISPMRGWVMAAIGVLALFTIAGLAKPALDRLLLESANTGNVAAGNWVVVGVVLVGVAAGLTGFLLRIAAGRVNRGVQYLLQRRTFARLSRLGLSIFDRHSPGEIATRVVRDLDVVATFADSGLYMMAVSLALFAGTIVVLAVWSSTVALAVIPFVVVLVLLTAIAAPVTNVAYDRNRTSLGNVIRRTQEDLAGRHVLAEFGASQLATEAFEESAWKLRLSAKRALTSANVYDAAVSGVAALATAALLSAAGDLALSDQLSVASVVALYAYLGRAMLPVQLFAGTMRFALNSRVSLKRLGDLYEYPLATSSDNEVECGPLAGGIQFDSVSFTYPGTDRQVLHDVSFELPAGKVIAVVGPTGAGKSSVAKLLSRIYDPDTGAVLVDGQDLLGLERSSYRNRVGVVPQDAFLFKGTVGSNLRYGRSDAPPELVAGVLDALGLHDFVASLPEGLETRVEEEGRNLLPAQRQLIALGRAWLVDPEVLVLDEATASLEPETEQQVLAAVRELGCTAVMVAHRLVVAEESDLVVVMRDGRVAEVGEHSRLLAAGGFYSTLWGVGAGVAGSATTAGS